MITKICSHCKKEFSTFPSRIGRYCSRRCSAFGNPNKHFKKGHTIIVPHEARARQGEKMRAYRGEKCWNWKGNNISKRQIHWRIQRLKGKPDTCTHCGKKAVDWANKDHKYSLNPNDYIPLCRKCHMNYDFKKGLRHA